MKIQVEIYILIEIIFTVFYAKCHNELTFLKDIEEKYQVQELIITNNSGNNENIFSTNTQNLKGSSEELNKIIPDYDMYVVSIQWGNTVCLESDYCQSKIKSLRRNIMTLHGLWPSLKSGSFLPECNPGEEVPISIADKSLLDKMKADWPSYTGPDEKFWTHEYNKHGYCYTNKSKTQGYVPYFSLGMDIFKKYQLESFIDELIEKSTQEEILITIDELNGIIAKKFPYIYFDLDCKRIENKNYLGEIRIYLDLDFNSFSPKIRRSDCPTSHPIYIGKFFN